MCCCSLAAGRAHLEAEGMPEAHFVAVALLGRRLTQDDTHRLPQQYVLYKLRLELSGLAGGACCSCKGAGQDVLTRLLVCACVSHIYLVCVGCLVIATVTASVKV